MLCFAVAALAALLFVVRLTLAADKQSENQMVIQIEGNTILHLYCIDYVPLNLMLTYMSKRHPEMLSSILMKNHKGETPLDIAIRFESK